MSWLKDAQDMAKEENVKGYDEAIRQIDAKINANKSRIDFNSIHLLCNIAKYHNPLKKKK